MAAAARFRGSSRKNCTRKRHADRGLPTGEAGAVTAIQRANSDLRLNPHFHSLFLDGVYGPDSDGRGHMFHDDHVPLDTEKPWSDGTSAVEISPLAVLSRLAASVPRPRAHLVRYHGVLGPAAKDREKVVPRPGPVELGRPAAEDGPREIDLSKLPRFSRLPWAVLLKRVFLVDVLECPKCKGRRKILAADGVGERDDAVR